MSLVLPGLIGANKPSSASSWDGNGLSASFDGSDDTLDCTIPASLMASDFTTSIWVRLDGDSGLASADGAFWANNYGASGKVGWRLYFDGNTATNAGLFSVWVSNGSGSYDNPVAAVQSGALGDLAWANIVWGRNSPFLGQADEAAIWDSALTSAQISNIYRGETNGGSGGTNGNAGDLSTFSPEIWWRMGDGTGDTNSSGGAPANGGTVGTILNQGSLASSNSAVGANGTLFSNSAP